MPNEFGAYVIASGCGSGKTTIIKQLIRYCSNEGILYAASTIDECNDMFLYCYDLVINNLLSLDDLILIHSGECPIPELNGLFGEWRNIYKNNPELIKRKKVIICTHHKLLNTHPATFIRYEWNTYTVDYDDLSPMELATTVDSNGAIKRYPRQLILIDELPTCNTFQFVADPTVLRSLADEEYILEPVENPKPGECPYRAVTVYPKVFHKPKGYRRFNASYNAFIEGTKHELWNSSTEKDRDTLMLAKGIVYDNFEDIINMKSPIVMRYNISDFVLERRINTRIILFDGTGDLTFYKSRRFNLLTFNDKYNSPIDVERFHNNLERKQVRTENTFIIDEKINQNVNELSNIISRNNKTLIVTWKDFKDEEIKPKGKNIYSVSSMYLNEDLSLPDVYTNRLITIGHKYDRFKVIHYMSGLDKATNKFRDFDAIVFLGKFRVPNYAVGDFNRDYRVETDIDRFSLYQLVQAITRTRIRNHRGDHINIYFSDDWDNKIIEMTKYYLSNNEVHTKSSENEFLLNIRPKWRSDISVLMNSYPNLKDAILRNEGCIMEVSLDDIYNLIPRKERKVRSYYPLISYLETLNIDLIITSECRNRFSIIP